MEAGRCFFWCCWFLQGSGFGAAEGVGGVRFGPWFVVSVAGCLGGVLCSESEVFSGVQVFAGELPGQSQVLQGCFLAVFTAFCF